MASTIFGSVFRTTFGSCGSSHDEPANHPTVISNGAGRRLFFPLRSCEAVGPRSETSAPPSVFFCEEKSLFDFSDREYMTFLDAKQRFSNRVADYVRYRPSYPAAVLDLLRAECGLSAEHTIAHICSGTGILSKLFLENGNPVFGVEPNTEMRQAGEEFLRSFQSFVSVAASADPTTLGDATIDFVTAAQAFHWFDLQTARREFAPILKPGGSVVI